METLLCRRADLALSSGKSVDEADPVAQRHIDSCRRCQRMVAMDASIVAALIRSPPPLPSNTRREIEVLVHLRARDERRAQVPDLRAAVAAFAAVAVLIFGILMPPRVSVAPGAKSAAVVAAEPQSNPPLSAGEHLSGLGELVARHRGGARTGSALPAGALRYETKLPQSLADQLLIPAQGLSRASWDGLPPTEVDEATLFVLDKSRVMIEPALHELLDIGETLQLHYGPHQVTLSIRGGTLFVIIASPVGLEVIARPWL